MQIKIALISNNFSKYSQIVRKNTPDYKIDFFSHIEANRKSIFKTHYDLFIVDIESPWLATPNWIREQLGRKYFYLFLFLSDMPVANETRQLLGHRLYDVFSHKKTKVPLERLINTVREYILKREYPNALEKQPEKTALIGSHPEIQRNNLFIQLVSRSPFTPCLIRGESGVGKRHCARLIHKNGKLGEDLYFEKNCEGITTAEFLSDLFGTAEGSEVYGPKRIGLIEKYAGGTIVLKNIEKIPMEAQAKLLNYLKDKTFKVVNSNQTMNIPVRIIGITRHPLEWFVKTQHFNADLFYHLSVFEVELPPLRERPEDIETVSTYYMQHYNYLYEKEITEYSQGALNCIKQYRWPGNISELKEAVEKAVFATNSTVIETKALPESVKLHNSNPAEHRYFGRCSLKDIEKIHIEHTIRNLNGNKSKAAKLLQISRTTLREKMRQYGLEPFGNKN
jgi:DNA-binding NtrC family response regulator